MAYNGYLIKVGDYVIPHKYIKADSYQVTNYGQDLDSYQDADGSLHRQALSLQAPKIEFETRNMLDDEQLWDLMSNIKRNYIDAVEKSANVECYIPELHKYVTSKMYMVDFQPKLYFADKKTLKYNSTRIAFISYGVSTI